MTAVQDVRVGIVGGGLMGREAAVAFARWDALVDHPCRPVLKAVCDLDANVRGWFRRFGSVDLLTADHRELLASELDVVYVAVPHHLHETIYLDVLDAGRDLLAEKPFGIDLGVARRLVEAIDVRGSFVRVSSEMPFFPGAQMVIDTAANDQIGPIIDVASAFLHSSDLNLDKPINWKRQVASCGAIGVMGDLGLHALHVPLRLGWQPTIVFACLQDLVPERPDGHGGRAACDTYENATLSCRVDDPAGTFPMAIETKRIAPGQMDTWRLRVIGMRGGAEFSTRQPQVVRRFRVDERGRQGWEAVQPGFKTVFPTITGGIFEFGFPDALLQMWASFLAERSGALGERFACATPAEALRSHELFDAALRSHRSGAAIAVGA